MAGAATNTSNYGEEDEAAEEVNEEDSGTDGNVLFATLLASVKPSCHPKVFDLAKSFSNPPKQTSRAFKFAWVKQEKQQTKDKKRKKRHKNNRANKIKIKQRDKKNSQKMISWLYPTSTTCPPIPISSFLCACTRYSLSFVPIDSQSLSLSLSSPVQTRQIPMPGSLRVPITAIREQAAFCYTQPTVSDSAPLVQTYLSCLKGLPSTTNIDRLSKAATPDNSTSGTKQQA